MCEQGACDGLDFSTVAAGDGGEHVRTGRAGRAAAGDGAEAGPRRRGRGRRHRGAQRADAGRRARPLRAGHLCRGARGRRPRAGPDRDRRQGRGAAGLRRRPRRAGRLPLFPPLDRPAAGLLSGDHQLSFGGAAGRRAAGPAVRHPALGRRGQRRRRRVPGAAGKGWRGAAEAALGPQRPGQGLARGRLVRRRRRRADRRSGEAAPGLVHGRADGPLSEAWRRRRLQRDLAWPGAVRSGRRAGLVGQALPAARQGFRLSEAGPALPGVHALPRHPAGRRRHGAGQFVHALARFGAARSGR